MLESFSSHHKIDFSISFGKAFGAGACTHIRPMHTSSKQNSILHTYYLLLVVNVARWTKEAQESPGEKINV
jgi:hypothetical protein